jgi:hypothetical protein
MEEENEDNFSDNENIIEEEESASDNDNSQSCFNVKKKLDSYKETIIFS